MRAGIVIPDGLPLMDDGLALRSSTESVDRLLSLNAVAAVAYGFDRAKAMEWVQKEGLDRRLSPSEMAFLTASRGEPRAFQVQVESMWALAWAVGLVVRLDFWTDCDRRFAEMLPNLKVGQSSAPWRQKAHNRQLEEVVAECDLGFCLHWAVRDAELKGLRPPDRLKPFVVVERRRALEWLVGSQDWDSVTLDT